MEIFSFFVLLVLVFCKNVFTKREIVSVGDIQYECGDDGQIIRTESNSTKIRLPANCKALYSVNTERTTNCTNQQRCTLMKWKIIREIEIFLNKYYGNTGPQGIIEFKNEMLVPNFNYLLHVTLKNSGGQFEEKDFTITFSDGSHNKSKDVLGYLDLNIGSPYVYSTLPVIINANVTLCGNISYYFFRWSVITTNQGFMLPGKSSELKFSPQILETSNEKDCIIKCTVFDINSNRTILEGSKTINIKDPLQGLEPEINVILPFRYTTINKGAPISIIPYIHSSFMSAEYKVEWSCMFENNWVHVCQGQTNKEFYVETGFDQKGNYTITLKVTNEKLVSIATCIVLIDANGPSIEFEIEHPIRPELGIEIIANIYELRTYCTVQWNSEKEHHLELNLIPGFSKEIYNISSKDKTFLNEIEEYGKITVTKEFKLKIPPQSRTWNGLDASTYNLDVIVSCPTLAEINDLERIKESPENFITISAQTEFCIPPSPRARSLKVFSDNDGEEALKSNYFYEVIRADNSSSPTMYKYGFILENLEVIFYSGINTFSAKTILPYNGENGIETFIEMCDYQNRCGKTFGPVIVTRQTDDLNDSHILKTFKQLLVEEDYYKAFSYAFIVLHSVNLSAQNKTYADIFSSEIAQNIQILTERNGENKGAVIKDFIKNLVIFMNHLELSEAVRKQLLALTKDFSKQTNSLLRVARDASRKLLSENGDKAAILEEIKSYLATSEYLVLHSLNAEGESKEKDHMLNLLDGWMVQACNMIFHGQRVGKIEMQTMTFSIERISKILLDRYITLNNNVWNVMAKFKIHNMSDYSSNKLCLGQAMLQDFFNKNGIIFGANIYSGEDQLMEISFSAKIRAFLPIDIEISKIMKPQCRVYKSGFNLQCLVVKQFINIVECLCPIFGYYFIDYAENITDVEGREIVFQNKSNDDFNKTGNDETDDSFYRNAQLGQKISYVVIVSSLVGFLILCYIIRKLTMPQQNIGLDGFHDTAYGHVMHEETLE